MADFRIDTTSFGVKDVSLTDNQVISLDFSRDIDVNVTNFVLLDEVVLSGYSLDPENKELVTIKRVPSSETGDDVVTETFTAELSIDGNVRRTQTFSFKYRKVDSRQASNTTNVFLKNVRVSQLQDQAGTVTYELEVTIVVENPQDPASVIDKGFFLADRKFPFFENALESVSVGSYPGTETIRYVTVLYPGLVVCAYAKTEKETTISQPFVLDSRL